MAAAISLLLPTRDRPALAQRFLESVWREAAEPASVEVVVYVDEDDEASRGIGHPHLNVVKIVGPRVSMGRYNSACLERSVGEIIVLCNDDIVVRTRGWDDRIRALQGRIPDGIFLAYPNDLFKGARLCAFPIISRKLCSLLQRPFPVEYKGAFIDYHLLDIFKRLEGVDLNRIIYLADVVFEHMHYRVKKGVFDHTYRARGRFLDDPVFLALRDERSAMAARLMEEIRGTAPAGRHVPGRTARGPKDGVLRASLLDEELPLRWRIFLFNWFLARRIAAALQ